MKSSYILPLFVVITGYLFGQGVLTNFTRLFLLESKLKMTHKDILKLSARIVPPLKSSLHKGSSGRIAVVGGSFEYCGAPYYAGLSALRVGADLSYIFCTSAAAIPIKSYSPELMVLPCLDSQQDVKRGLDRLPGLHSVVIGPGLGRNETVFESVLTLVKEILILKKSLVLDGDALFLLAQKERNDFRTLIKSTKTILTPNKVEFNRIFACIFPDDVETLLDMKPLPKNKFWFDEKETAEIRNDLKHPAFRAVKLAQALDVTILQKGSVDIITDGKVVAINSLYGSNRRCGGQGDLLAGSTAVFSAWKDILAEQLNKEEEHGSVLGCFAASCLTRKANELGFKKKGRSLVTPDIIDELGNSFEFLFNKL